MAYIYTDGGRSEAGLKTKTDCGIRAMAIACNIPYTEARKALKEASKNGKMGSAAIARGIYKEDMEAAYQHQSLNVVRRVTMISLKGESLLTWRNISRQS